MTVRPARRSPPRPRAAELRRHLGDAVVGPDVHHGAVEQLRALNQQGVSSDGPSTRPLCPNARTAGR